jgi:multiple sugar transport system ATP-binding protein
MAAITFRNVGKRYANGFVAIEDLDLKIADREFLVLLGPSGCGKSTTLNMIAGLEDVTSGTLSFDGAKVNDLPPDRRDVAMVFQSYALYPHKTVYENIAFGLRMRRTPEREVDARVRSAAEKLAITHLLERRPGQLSGGQRQRVALGRAMVRKPAVFLMDEPLSNLDAALRISMRAEIKQLHMEMQTTFVYVTHDQAEALTLADRIVVMKDGAIEQIGTPHDIYEKPATTFVASFLGNPPINFIEGSVEDVGGARVFRSDTLALALPPHVGGAAGTRATLGIRAEDVVFDPAAPADRAIEGTVHSILPIGSDQFIGLQMAGKELYFRLAKDQSCRLGDHVRLSVLTNRLHVFATDTGRSLAEAGA